jgi:aminomethyltransferase
MPIKLLLLTRYRTQHKFVGDGAVAFLERICPSSVSSLAPFQSTYSAFLNDKAGIVDDTIITNITEAAPTYYVVTNAANFPAVKEYFTAELDKFSKPESVSWEIVPNTGMIALQGPIAPEVLQSLQPEKANQPFDLSTLTFGHSAWLTFKLPGGDVSPALLVSRTGYTGEDGFELAIPHPNPSVNSTEAFTKALLDAGAGNVRLAGLGARDILRIEAGLCLHGNDIDASTTPVQGSIGWIIPKSRKTGDAGFNGAEILYGANAAKAGKKRVGIIMDQPTVARHGMKVFAGDQEVGEVTSGGPSPTLSKPIAMASVKSAVKVGDQVDVEIRGKKRKGSVVKMPFVATKYFKG